MAIPFLNNLDLNWNQLLKAKLHVSSTAPSNGAEGGIWFDSSTGDQWLKIHDDSNWKKVAWYDGSIAALGNLGLPLAADQVLISTAAGAIAWESGATLRTSIGVDAAGTDNSTNVTLVTTSHDYLSISGQAITLGEINIGDDTNLSVSDTTGQTGINLTLSAGEISGSVSGLTTTSDVTFNDLTLDNDLVVKGNVTLGDATTDTVTINGDLIVSGTQTTKTSETVLIEDNIITLNSNEAGTASEDSGIEVERGSGTNVKLIWNETSDRWTFTSDGSTFYNIPIPTEYDTHSSTGAADVDGSNGVVVQDMTIDAQGHVTGTGTVDLDNRYYQKTEVDAQSKSWTISGDGSTTEFAHTHSWGTRKILVQILEYGDAGSGATYETVFAEVLRHSDNAVKIIFSVAPSATQDYLVLMQKITG